MKKMSFCLIFSIPAFAFAQVTPKTVAPNEPSVQTQLNNVGIESYSASIQTFDLSYEGVKGSRFFNDEYAAGEIWMTNGKHYTSEMVYRFDELENSVQIKYPSKKELLLYNFDVLSFNLIINGATHSYVKADVKGIGDAHKFFRVIFKNEKCQLIKWTQKIFEKSDNSGAYSREIKYDAYVAKNRYYVKTDEGKFREMGITKKEFLKKFPTKKAIVEKLFSTINNVEKEMTDAKIADFLTTIEAP